MMNNNREDDTRTRNMSNEVSVLQSQISNVGHTTLKIE